MTTTATLAPAEPTPEISAASETILDVVNAVRTSTPLNAEVG